MTTDRARHMKASAHREFESWAETYDRSLLSRLFFEPTYRALLEEIVRWRQDRSSPFTALDIGCGTGTLASMLAASSLPVEVTGLDYTPSMVRLANEKAQQFGIRDRCRFVRADAEHLPFAPGSFDLVTCSHSFHHYPHQQEAIHQMSRVLRPEGRLMLADGFRDNVIGWFIFDVFVTSVEKAVYHVPWSSLRSMFHNAGLRDVRQRKINWLAPALLVMGSS